MKRIHALGLAAMLAACAPRTHTVSTTAHRIVTLMPSFAEDLCAIGARDVLVGVSVFSSGSACGRGLPEVNNFSSVNTEKIVALRADRVIAIPEQASMVTGIERAHIPVTLLPDDTYDDIFSDIAALGALTGRRAQAAHVIGGLKLQTGLLQKHEHYRKKPTVFFVEQAQPIWTVGPHSFIATLIGLAGGRIATQALRRPYAQYSDEALLRSDPDVIVATGDAHIEQVLNREPWRSLRAVRRHHVFVDQDSNALTRPSPHYLAGLQWLIARFSSL